MTGRTNGWCIDQTSATQYKGLAELAKAYYPQMTKALEAQDIDSAILDKKSLRKLLLSSSLIQRRHT